MFVIYRTKKKVLSLGMIDDREVCSRRTYLQNKKLKADVPLLSLEFPTKFMEYPVKMMKIATKLKRVSSEDRGCIYR